MLKKCPPAIFTALQTIFNASINSGIFPSQWKDMALIDNLFIKRVIYLFMIRPTTDRSYTYTL